MTFSRAKKQCWSGALALIAASLVGCLDGGSDSGSGNETEGFAFTAVTVIDGRGGEAKTGYTVIVRNGLIDAVEPDGAVPLDDVEEIESNGKFLIPGLWDLHAHTFADEAVYEVYLEAGVTTLRDMGCPAECVRKMQRDRMLRESDPTRSPRLIIAGPMIDGDSPYDAYASHHQVSLETIPEAIGMLQELQVDFVKIRDFLSVDEFYAVAEAAEEAGLSFAGHIPTAVPAPEAVRGGMLTVEHEGSLFGGLLLATSSSESQLRQTMLGYMQEAVASGDIEGFYAKALGAEFLGKVVATYDAAKADDLVQSFVDSGAAIVPTLIVQDPQLRSPSPVFNGRNREDDTAMQTVPDNILNSWRERAATHVLDQEFPVEDLAAMADHYELLVTLVGEMHRAGVPVLVGTDGAYPDGTPWIWPGYGVHDELELLVDAGLSPAEAIAAASGRAASHLEIAGVGTIEAGNTADLVLLTADPLADIRNTTKIADVIIGGEFVDREAIVKRRIDSLAGNQ